MALRLAIDGYNLIGLGGLGDIEAQREKLLMDLKSYRKRKGAEITVVFDGRGPSRTKEIIEGMEVVFSGAGEKADDILREYAKNMREAITLVTSDRAVASYAVNSGAVVISSREFLSRLESARYEELKGFDEEEEPKPTKGQARKLKKRERLRRLRLKKL
jgi:predicted RNA-binding protein with PIN domain